LGALARLGTTHFRQGFFTRSVAFAPDGKTLACAASGRGLCLWDLATGEQLRQIGRSRDAGAAAFSPDGKTLAASLDTDGPGIYEAATGRKVCDLPCDVGTTPGSLAYAPDGRTLAAAGKAAIFLFDAATGEERQEAVPCAEDRARCLAWSPDGTLLAWGSEHGALHLMHAARAEEVGRWDGHGGPVRGLAFAPDGGTLASTGGESIIRLWDVPTGKEKPGLDTRQPSVHALAFSRKGGVLASAQADGTIALWDAGKREAIRRWQAHALPASTLDFSPDGKTLASGAPWECGPRLWEVRTGEEAGASAGHHAVVEDLAFSADGARIRSLGRDKVLLTWDLATARGIRTFLQPRWVLDSCKVSRRGRLVATWSHLDGTLRLWDAATGKERHVLGRFGGGSPWPQPPVRMSFSPDDSRLALGGATGRGVLVWDAFTGQLLQELHGLAGAVRCVTFSADGQLVAAGATRQAEGQATIRLWAVGDGRSTAVIACAERVDTLAFSPDG
jgi:WD40 repeat protein